MKKFKLIYINKNQFGYHTDAYMHCKYSKNLFEILFICFDSGYTKVVECGINVVYIKDRNNKIINGLLFSMSCFFYLLINRSFIFIQYFPGCSWIKRLFFWKNMILDIRSVSISNDEGLNFKLDQKITKEATFFNKVTVITENVRGHLNLPQNKTSILPIGTNTISSINKNFSEGLNLLYVGTLNNRNINQTIEGLALFRSKNPDQLIKYYVVGDGTEQEKFNIKNCILENNLNETVFFLGRKRHIDIQYLWDCCQIGISYVPISKAYNLQPPTKTFEYLSAGMAVIATKTQENLKVINNKYGVLIEDTPLSFCQGLGKLISNRDNYNSDLIRGSVVNNNWELIVKKCFISLFSVNH